MSCQKKEKGDLILWSEKKGESKHWSLKSRDHLQRNNLWMFSFFFSNWFWKITCLTWDLTKARTHTISSHWRNIVIRLIDLVQYLGHFLFLTQLTRCWTTNKQIKIKKNKQEKTNEWKLQSVCLRTIISSSCDWESPNKSSIIYGAVSPVSSREESWWRAGQLISTVSGQFHVYSQKHLWVDKVLTWAIQSESILLHYVLFSSQLL